ncbi:hypothetical protein E2C01_011913 [Portunus trituberculatus]|uniref:Uncharacterized protein n=1 Tax=Portunus trituberculatus TaxID=210409 RepID=A0A5B7DCG0_PORTR|nr:hypothetical protein [Portunus trituberculatus]
MTVCGRNTSINLALRTDFTRPLGFRGGEFVKVIGLGAVYLGVREAAFDCGLGFISLPISGLERGREQYSARWSECAAEGLGAQVSGGGGAAVRHHAGERSHRPAVEPWRSVSHLTHIPAQKFSNHQLNRGSKQLKTWQEQCIEAWRRMVSAQDWGLVDVVTR